MNAPLRLPLDEIAPQHREIHSDLEAWGRWNVDRKPAKVRCGSAERNYITNWRQYHYPSIAEMMPRLPNPRNREIDRAILLCALRHQEVLRRYYVFRQRPEHICRRMPINFIHFGQLIFKARAGVINNLGRLGLHNR